MEGNIGRHLEIHHDIASAGRLLLRLLYLLRKSSRCLAGARIGVIARGDQLAKIVLPINHLLQSSPCERAGNFFSDSPDRQSKTTSRVHIMTRPKAVIFDLGGVLISSPLKGIQDYETEHGIPHGYLNYAMSCPEATKLTVDPPPHPMRGQTSRLDDYEQTRHSILDGLQIFPHPKHGKSSIAQRV